jgi:hypothetical protein
MRSPRTTSAIAIAVSKADADPQRLSDKFVLEADFGLSDRGRC